MHGADRGIRKCTEPQPCCSPISVVSWSVESTQSLNLTCQKQDFLCIHCKIAHSFWNNFLFGVKNAFYQKRKFPQKRRFLGIYWQYSYNKSPVYKISQSGIVALILDQFFTCQASYLGKTQLSSWRSKFFWLL